MLIIYPGSRRKAALRGPGSGWGTGLESSKQDRGGDSGDCEAGWGKKILNSTRGGQAGDHAFALISVCTSSDSAPAAGRTGKGREKTVTPDLGLGSVGQVWRARELGAGKKVAEGKYDGVQEREE